MQLGSLPLMAGHENNVLKNSSNESLTTLLLPAKTLRVMKANPLLKALVPKKAVNQILQNDYICDHVIYLKFDLKHSHFLVAFCMAVKDYHKVLPISCCPRQCINQSPNIGFQNSQCKHH